MMILDDPEMHNSGLSSENQNIFKNIFKKKEIIFCLLKLNANVIYVILMYSNIIVISM